MTWKLANFAVDISTVPITVDVIDVNRNIVSCSNLRPHIFEFDCGVFQQNVLERFSWAEKMKSTGAVGTDVKAEVEA